MTEARFESAFEPDRERLAAVNVGIMRGVGEELVVFGMMGRSVWSNDGTAHTFVGLGLKVLVHPPASQPGRAR